MSNDVLHFLRSFQTGGMDPRLRAYCLREMMKRDLPGFAIGGLAGGEDKWHFWRVVHQCTGYNPRAQPPIVPAVPPPPIDPKGPPGFRGENGITCSDPIPSPDPLNVTVHSLPYPHQSLLCIFIVSYDHSCTLISIYLPLPMWYDNHMNSVMILSVV
jgi:hypothetical protein